jgi:hypothetical protein
VIADVDTPVRRLNMRDCADDVLAYHGDEVTLGNGERNEMRKRRDSNRDRLKAGLDKAGKPAPREFVKQGSYAMRTMTQHPENDYDIDDGVYFDKEKLVGPRGGEMTALDARQMVRDAVDDGSFKTPPEVKKNCVRVQYDAGYHVDLPVYRWVVTLDPWGREVARHAELASSEWKRSDARHVTDWFNEQNHRQSPDKDNGRQMRRMVRLIKKFARSRDSWKQSILSGFGITILVTECYRADKDREDKALYDTMEAIRNRLNWNLVVKHPVTPDHTITKGDDDPKAKFLRDKLTDALDWLAPTLKADCTRKEALKCWDKVFNTTYFSDRYKGDDDEGGGGAKGGGGSGVMASGLFSQGGSPPPVRKEGGGRYA